LRRTTAPDTERLNRLRQAMSLARLDALVCARPADVLLLTGYWPVIGTAVAVVDRHGSVAVAAPEDEGDEASRGWADVLRFFPAGSLHELPPAPEAVREPLETCLRALGLRRGRVGWEGGASTVPVPYVALHCYGSALGDLLRQLLPEAELVPAESALRDLRATLTARELRCIATACGIAAEAYRAGVAAASPGTTETELAAAIRSGLSTQTVSLGGSRADGFVFCMSGPNAAEAYGSHAASTGRRLHRGDLVLLHCNSYVDGFWTDITRTYVLGAPAERQHRLYSAVFAARDAALEAIGPGARAAELDRTARSVLASRGLGEAFRHSTGHGVGFAAIDHLAKPRLHPASPDRLEPGMVFNVEPAVYLPGIGGIRHCDVVTLGPGGVEVLTPFHARIEDLVLDG